MEVKRKLHWDESEDNNREVKWHQREENSINRLNDLINNKIDGVFGLGNKRTLKDYEYISGIDLINKIVKDKEKAFTGKFISSLAWDDVIF